MTKCEDQCSVGSADMNNDVVLDEAGFETKEEEGTVSRTNSNKSLMFLRMLANRANANWVERTSWTDPYVYDPTTLIMGRADIRIYKQLLVDLLQEGKVFLEPFFVVPWRELTLHRLHCISLMTALMPRSRESLEDWRLAKSLG